jgi:hypothetical protein
MFHVQSGSFVILVNEYVNLMAAWGLEEGRQSPRPEHGGSVPSPERPA